MRNCLNCDSSRSTAAFQIQDIFGDIYQWRVCQDCGLQYLDPFPSSEQFAQAYDESYYGEGDKKFLPIVESVVDFFRRRNAKAEAKRLMPNAKVLDIGCGNGSFLSYLGNEGKFELHGLELEGKSAKRAAEIKEIKLHLGELKEDTYALDSFDAIYLIHVFEHLPNPIQVIETINSILKEGGILTIEIPNISSNQAKWFGPCWLHLDPPRHLQLYPPQLLIQELKKRGFNLIEEKYFSIQYNPFGFQQSLLNWVGIKRDLLYESLKGNMTYQKGESSVFIMLQKLFHWLTLPKFIVFDFIASRFKRSATVKLVFKKGS